MRGAGCAHRQRSESGERIVPGKGAKAAEQTSERTTATTMRSPILSAATNRTEAKRGGAVRTSGGAASVMPPDQKSKG
jgi:hypothetical protein